MPGHEPPRKTYGYGTAKSREELTARYKKLQLGAVLPQLQKGLSALVYTQLTDVEDEVNGLFTYDRTAIKPDANAVRSVNAALAAEFARVVKFTKGAVAGNAVCRCNPSREKAILENPQIFQNCKYKNIFSAEDG